MKLSDAHFGVVMVQYGSQEMTEVNIFDFGSIKWAVANYIAYPEKRLPGDWLSHCFFDCRGKCEFEFLLMGRDGRGEPKKVDIWTMYIEPNRRVLYDIVQSISKTSCLQYIRAERKRLKQRSTK